MKRNLVVAAPLASGTCSVWAAPEDKGVGFVLPSGVRVEITEAAFKRSAFRVVGCKQGGSICTIDGHFPFGSNLTIPSIYLKKITVTYGGKSHSLDSSNMHNAWGARPLRAANGK
jgi:hypothetical protein